MQTGVPSADVELDIDTIRALLKAQHPDLAAFDIEPVSSGWDNFQFRLGKDLALRFPRRELGSRCIEIEQRWLQEIAPALSLPVPAPIRIGHASHGYPYKWSVVPWLRGVPATRCGIADDEATTLATFLRSLHIAAPAAAPINPYRSVPLLERASAIEERMDRVAAQSSIVTTHLRSLWQTALHAPIDVELTWIHGDLHPNNILVDRGKLSGIIDWGDMGRGDRAIDLAAIWMLLDDAAARRRAFDESDVSAATHSRTVGWVIYFGVTLLDAGLVNDPEAAALGERILRCVASGEK